MIPKHVLSSLAMALVFSSVTALPINNAQEDGILSRDIPQCINTHNQCRSQPGANIAVCNDQARACCTQQGDACRNAPNANFECNRQQDQCLGQIGQLNVHQPRWGWRPWGQRQDWQGQPWEQRQQQQEEQRRQQELQRQQQEQQRQQQEQQRQQQEQQQRQIEQQRQQQEQQRRQQEQQRQQELQRQREQQLRADQQRQPWY